MRPTSGTFKTISCTYRVKEGDHALLFDHVRAAEQAGQFTLYKKKDPSADIVHRFRFCQSGSLNASNAELLVFYRVWEISGDTCNTFCWDRSAGDQAYCLSSCVVGGQVEDRK